MSERFDITVPTGMITWFGEQPKEMGGPCPHVCRHSGEVIAWGPTLDLYEMVQCQSCGCRGWRSPKGPPEFREVL